MKSYID